MVVTGEGKMTNGLKAKTAMFTIFLIFTTVLAMSCQECPTEPEYEIDLSVEDYLCTWVDLRVTLTESSNSKYISIKSIDGEIEFTPSYGIIGSDTVLRIDGLQPLTEYSFRAYYLKHDKAIDSSNIVTIHTRETTSSNFRWEIDRIGVHPTCLNDVQIISENNVWVVGDIRLEDTYTYDSAGVWQEPYSGAHWDGNEWKLIRFIEGTVRRPNGIKCFSDSSIWLTPGSICYYDGSTTKQIWIQNYSAGEFLYRVWGSSESDIWFVGSEGLIVHYDGETFSRIPTGNTIRYVDVEGTPDGKNVFVVGHNLKIPYECCVWHFIDGNGQIIYYTDDPNQTEGTYGSVYRVGLFENKAYFKTVTGMWVYDFKKNTSELDPAIADAPITSMIVQDRNDIMGLCADGSWAHYNGQNWSTNDDFYWSGTISCNRADFKGDFALMVGVSRDASCGVIIRGYR
ncbi:MAG: hypothetical protein COT43_07160 [Candidatus Marinimicrobia bacterium CG08_land_8_20_14_0_20_45_22]|nr:MAG: hypothetical protein COT43_07160 [Candidatus Marinimicrobia bacterium CG08_land_8_20_14_0_20_45_22]